MTERGITCERAAELLSDHLEGTLGGVIAADLRAHLETCAACRDLKDALADVVLLLHTGAEVAPAPDLAERAATAALRAGRRARAPLEAVSMVGRLRRLVPRPSSWGVPASVQAVAAVLAIALSGLLLFAGSAAKRQSWATTVPRVTERVAGATVYLVERKDRLVEDFRLLRVVISTAFEGRVDRVNDRVEDYRRLLERRRQDEKAKDDKKGQASLGGQRFAGSPAPDPETSEPTPRPPRRRTWEDEQRKESRT